MKRRKRMKYVIFFYDITDKNVKNFFSNNFELIRNGRDDLNSLVETHIRFKLDDKIRVIGILDLGFKNKDRFIINDWKTGNLEVEDTSLQLLVYAMWIMQQPFYLGENITLFKSYLRENKLEELEWNNRQILRTKAVIRQDFEIMEELNKFGENANFNAFEKKIGKICSQCFFKSICDKN